MVLGFVVEDCCAWPRPERRQKWHTYSYLYLHVHASHTYTYSYSYLYHSFTARRVRVRTAIWADCVTTLARRAPVACVRARGDGGSRTTRGPRQQMPDHSTNKPARRTAAFAAALAGMRFR